MPAQFDSKPDKARPVNQPLIFAISDSGTTPDRFVVQTFEDGVEISKVYLTPNEANKSFFDLSAIARERVKVDDVIRDESEVLFSYDTKAFTTGRYGLRKYEVKIGTYTGTSETLDDASAEIWLCDGADQISKGLHPSFEEYYMAGVTDKGWMTSREKSSIITLYAEEKDQGIMAFLNSFNVLGGLASKVHYEIFSGSTSLATQDFLLNVTNGAQAPSATDVNQSLTYMGIYPDNLTYVDAAKRPSNNPTWTHYTLRCATSATPLVGISNTLKIVKTTCLTAHDRVQLTFSNSVGGWDVLNFTGRAMTNTTQTSKTYKRNIGDWNGSTFTFLPSARESVPYQVTASESYDLKSVNFTDSDMSIMPELVKSDNVFIRLSAKGEWLPVILDSKSTKVGSSIAQIHDVSLSVTLAQTIKC